MSYSNPNIFLYCFESFPILKRGDTVLASYSLLPLNLCNHPFQKTFKDPSINRVTECQVGLLPMVLFQSSVGKNHEVTLPQ